MPFTFSHPAIVLPLSRFKRIFSLTGLVAGSVAPDFEYFLRMKIHGEYGHTIFGLVWFDLPLGLIISFIFHGIVRDSLIDNLPRFLRARFVHLQQFDWNKRFAKAPWIVLFSALIGAISHFLWDNFTHGHGYFVNRISFFRDSITFFGHQILIFSLLQHLSTIVGGLMIIIVVMRLPREKIEKRKVNKGYWILVILIAVAATGIRLVFNVHDKFYGNWIVTIISAGLIGLMLTPVLMKKYYHLSQSK